ncbi:cyclic nucleotide-binding domain-containing protein 2-like [Protopterus annectens]|uniref:cyclic nucleotide-binding domain-containing protein 2-like n=1 Tax=Protopterus annectens TaxID=7888 RepID=UPI001CFB7C5C|nr:cyclic nucleotide-binding domain-containing protein 2-like [Protopterus annectens]
MQLEWDQSKVLTAGLKKQRFQSAVRKVIILLSVTRQIIQIMEEATGFKFWGNVAVYTRMGSAFKERKMKEQKTKDQDPTFDTSSFKIQYEFTFPEKAMQIALQRPEERSEEGVRFIRSMMQGIPSFRRYSHHMQLMLARVVRYERFGRRRVVVQKGHRGNSFYFVFSGRIAVTQDKDGSSAFLDSEPILLKKGACFGEVALLKGLRRNATVVCMEETEFLVVDREDFFSNSLDTELKKEFQHRFNFFRSLELFSTWSEESLETLADHCKAEEFNHSQVVMSDTSETKNIIFVTKGRCDVLRLVELGQCASYHSWIKQQEVFLEKPTRSISADSEEFQNKTLLKFRSSQSPSPNMKNRRRDSSINRKSSSFSRTSKLQNENGFHDTEELKKKWLSKLNMPPGELPSGLLAAVYLRIDALRPGQWFTGVDIGYIESCLEKDGRFPKDKILNWVMEPEVKDSRGMAIVSQGSEIIRIKLDKFSELTDLCTLNKLRSFIRPYPSDDELCQIFLEQNRWKIFKGDIINSQTKPMCSNPIERLNLRTSKQNSNKNYEWDTEETGILHFMQAAKNQKVWITPRVNPDATKQSKCQGIENMSNKKEHLRLIHGIIIPKCYGRRLMY